MRHSRFLLEGNISFKEESLVRSVLAKYGIEATNIFKARSAYKIESQQGLVCLKRLHHGEKKALNGNLLVESLFKAGFNNTAAFLKTKGGKLYVKSHKYTFYATEWIDGKECDLENLAEVVNCVQLLAKFHLALNNTDTKSLKIKNNLKNWPKIFYSDLLTMEKFKHIIEKKRIKNEFDTLYANNIDNFYNRGLIALNVLNNSNYYRLSKEANESKTICHDSFYYQNILKKDESYYIIDLDSIIIDLQIMDLGKFIRRLMTKKNYQWNFDKAKYMIEAYTAIKPLSLEELEVMLAIIIFPHKFWKLGKKRYVKQKSWSETKYMHKLQKLITYSSLEQKFLTDYLNYLNLPLNENERDN
jgi:CotS family spore coat protein